MKPVRLRIPRISQVFEKMLDSRRMDIIPRVLPFFQELSEKATRIGYSDKHYLNSYFPSFPGRAWDRLFDGFERISWGERVPLHMDIAVSESRQGREGSCLDLQKETQGLSVAEIHKCLRDAKKMGTCSVGIIGDEPMMREDLLEILEGVPEGIETQLHTGGYRFTPEFARAAAKTRLSRVIISMASLLPEKAGPSQEKCQAFMRAVEAIQASLETEMYTAVNFHLADEPLSESEILNGFDFVRQLGVDEIRITLPVLPSESESRHLKRRTLDSLEFIKEIKLGYQSRLDYPTILLMSEYESPQCFGCGAGCNRLAISPEGYVTPCAAVPLAFGNLHQDDLMDVYEGMAKSFQHSRRTCYGKKVCKALRSAGLDAAGMPLSIEESIRWAEQNRAEGQPSDFFARHMAGVSEEECV